MKYELDQSLENNVNGGNVAYVTVDASSLEGGDNNSAPLIHLQNIYPSTSSNVNSRYAWVKPFKPLSKFVKNLILKKRHLIFFCSGNYQLDSLETCVN